MKQIMENIPLILDIYIRGKSNENNDLFIFVDKLNDLNLISLYIE